MGVETSLAIAAAAAVVSAGVGAYSAQQSVHQGKKQMRMAQEQQALAMKEQQEQKAKALEERKGLIDQQRENLVPGYRASTREETPKSSGLVGKLEKDILG